jgi:hypothetical protein
MARADPETNVTNDDVIMTPKIARAHLNEFPDYYTCLAQDGGGGGGGLWWDAWVRRHEPPGAAKLAWQPLTNRRPCALRQAWMQWVVWSSVRTGAVHCSWPSVQLSGVVVDQVLDGGLVLVGDDDGGRLAAQAGDHQQATVPGYGWGFTAGSS